MANSLNLELTGKRVILSGSRYRGNKEERMFLCESGFGCHSFTSGRAIYGKFVKDGEECRVDGYEIEGLAE
jgi:hypothetical protein